MRFWRVVPLAAVAVGAAACSKDTGPTTPSQEPVAFVRYVHAVPDTGATDWRPVDRLENSPPAFGLGFRGFTPYQAMGVGTRRIRVFPTSTDPNVTSKWLIDTTITFEANKYYTLLYTGFARAGQTPEDRIVVLTDDVPQPATDQVAFRAVHGAINVGPVDFFASAAGGAAPLPAAPTFANIAYGATSTYSTMAPGPLVMRATAAGTRTPVLAEATAPAGGGTPPSAGSTLGGTALTAILVPRAVAGSQAGTQTTPGIIWLIDRRPPGT